MPRTLRLVTLVAASYALLIPAVLVLRATYPWGVLAVIAIGAGAPAALWHLSARRESLLRHRLDHGLCPDCGYDLRASRQYGRCPECGRPTVPVPVPLGQQHRGIGRG